MSGKRVDPDGDEMPALDRIAEITQAEDLALAEIRKLYDTIENLCIPPEYQ